jgi:hypothetical protein
MMLECHKKKFLFFQAIEWYLQLLGLTPTDPVVLQKMGNIFDNEGDKQQVAISPTFYTKLLCTQIPKAQKRLTA